MNFRVISVAVLVLALLGGAGFFLMRQSDPGILVESPRLVATNTVPGDAMVFMTLRNTGGTPDLLIGAVSELAGQCGFYGPTVGTGSDGVPFITVPAGGATALAAETAHLELLGLEEPLEEGQLVPLTLVFQNAGEITIKARVEALVSPTELTKQAGLYEPLAGELVPEIALSAEPVEGGRWAVSVQLENFTFDEGAVDSDHVPGRGHAHLYIDNVKIGRLYEDRITTDPLPPGEHVISVTLNTNDHRAYARNGQPITATVTVKNE